MAYFVMHTSIMRQENKSEQIVIRCTEKTLKNLKARAEKERRKFSEFARIIIENEVDQ